MQWSRVQWSRVQWSRVLVISSACVAFSSLSRGAVAQNVVTVDFSSPADYPLLKDKLNLYNTSLQTTADLERDVKLLKLLNVESMRLEFAWGYGQTLSNVVGGNAANLTFDFSVPERWQELITGAGVLTHWSYDYTPRALSDAPGDVPPAAGWATCVQKAWQHFHDRGAPIWLHEVWNEPDFPALGFFKGTEQDYYALYERTATQLRALDADAKIAGPTTAFPFWLSAFTDLVHQKKLPLDALTFHQYTRLGENDHIAQAAQALGRYPELDTVELVMDEYHPYNPWPKDGPQQTFEGATDLLYDALRFARRPELTSLNWAQFQEPGPHTDQFLGLITVDGHPKASFNALRLYGMLPVDGALYTASGAPLDVLASADAQRGGIVLLNRTGADQVVDVKLAGQLFAKGQVRRFRIDKTHNSYLDGAGEHLSAEQTDADVELANWSFSGPIPQMGTLAFLFDADPASEPVKQVDIGKVVRVNRFYPSRTTRAYADFDRRTWVARLGMVSEQQANEQVGLTVEGLPSSLRFSSRVSGKLQKLDQNSALGVRLDFQVGATYERSVLFAASTSDGSVLYDQARTGRVPFGTQRQADSVVQVPNFDDFVVNLAEHAPATATGRVQITYVMQNTGVDTRAVISASVPEAGMPGGTGGTTADGSGGNNQTTAGGGNGADTVGSVGGASNGGVLAAGGMAMSGATSSAAAPGAASSSCACRTAPATQSRGYAALVLLLAVFAARRSVRGDARFRTPPLDFSSRG